MVYADYNATTPLWPEVIDVMSETMSSVYANPSSVHQKGREARGVIENARLDVAQFFSVLPTQVVFTSGGTESNNWVLRCSADCDQRAIFTSTVEHPSIINPLLSFQKMGRDVSFIAVDSHGVLDEQQLEKRLSKKAMTLVTLMGANNETGVIFDIPKYSALAKAHGALFHCDASQCVGKTSTVFFSKDVDFMTVSAHKFYGPKGVGALIIRDRSKLDLFCRGGGQEFGMRPGTENVAAIAGMATAMNRISNDEFTSKLNQIETLRDRFENGLLSELDDIKVLGVGTARVVNTSNIYFAGVDGESLIMSLDLDGICCSAASACHSGSTKPSHVVIAMGLNQQDAKRCLRFSFGAFSNEEEIDYTMERLIFHVNRMRKVR